MRSKQLTETILIKYGTEIRYFFRKKIGYLRLYAGGQS